MFSEKLNRGKVRIHGMVEFTFLYDAGTLQLGGLWWWHTHLKYMGTFPNSLKMCPVLQQQSRTVSVLKKSYVSTQTGNKLQLETHWLDYLDLHAQDWKLKPSLVVLGAEILWAESHRRSCLKLKGCKNISGYFSFSIYKLSAPMCETVLAIAANVLHCAKSAAGRAGCIWTLLSLLWW